MDELVQKLKSRVGPVNLVQAHGPQQVRRVGVLSGSAPNFVSVAAELGCDTFITGETDHAHYYEALNAGINVIYAGHYASETVGIQALGQHLVEKFGLAFEFCWICPRGYKHGGIKKSLPNHRQALWMRSCTKAWTNSLSP